MNKHIIGIVAAATLSGAANAEAYDWNEARQNLTAKRQSLAAVAAFSAVGDLNGLEKAFDNALNNGLAVNELKELVLQLYAYTGFPRCLNAAATLEKVVKSPPNRRKRGFNRARTAKNPCRDR